MTLAVGRMEGQLREVVHTVNNLAQKFEDLMRSVDKSAHLPTLVAENKAELAALDARVKILEASENRRVGAFGLGGWIMKTLPYLASIGMGGLIVKLIGG
ncbi:hypothetical protein Sbs19_29270 [Sphingobium sp. BS19]|nr:hypothetical protein Sbs19_29270 [Sphingobium sp. BS19]